MSKKSAKNPGVRQRRIGPQNYEGNQAPKVKSLVPQILQSVFSTKGKMAVKRKVLHKRTVLQENDDSLLESTVQISEKEYKALMMLKEKSAAMLKTKLDNGKST